MGLFARPNGPGIELPAARDLTPGGPTAARACRLPMRAAGGWGAPAPRGARRSAPALLGRPPQPREASAAKGLQACNVRGREPELAGCRKNSVYVRRVGPARRHGRGDIAERRTPTAVSSLRQDGFWEIRLPEHVSSMRVKTLKLLVRGRSEGAVDAVLGGPHQVGPGSDANVEARQASRLP